MENRFKNLPREPGRKIRVMIVFGTRPEAIKMCPLVLELRRRPAFQVTVCVTGQHREMLAQVLDAFGVEPDINLGIMSAGQTLTDVTVRVLRRIAPVLENVGPDIVLVHGDTTTTFAASLAAFYKRIPVGHVEAGLRTYDLLSPYPEEYNREAVSLISGFNFAPTETARDNLIREGHDPETVFVTGNTVIDALRTTVKEDFSHPELTWAADSRLVILTAHRRENLGEPMRHIFSAIRRVVDETPDVKVLYPIHLNPLVREAAASMLDGCDRIRLIEPLDVLDFHNLVARSYLVLTDSGGIQEEAPSLGKPVLVLRDTTERPEGVAAGTLRLAGTDRESIYREFRRLLTDPAAYDAMSGAKNPYGDGKASVRIADILEFGHTEV